MKIVANKFRKMPKVYIVVILMAVIVLFLMIFGGGKETLTGNGGTDVTFEDVSFTVKNWEEDTNEDGFPESLVIYSNEYRAAFEVDPIKVPDYEGLIFTLKKNLKLTAKIDKADKADLNKADEDVSVFRLTGQNGKVYVSE